MTWLPGQSGGGYPPRQCHPIALEDSPVVRAGRDPAPDGIESAVVRAGVHWQPRLLCPRCGSTRRFLYAPADLDWACRQCHKLDHRVRHELGDPLVRAMALRRELEAELAFASPLPPRPADRAEAKRYDELAIQIVVCEARALRRLREMCRGVERYVDRATAGE